MKQIKGINKIFIPMIILSLGLFVLLLSQGSTDFWGPFVILFGAIAGRIFFWLANMKINNKSMQALRNFVVYKYPSLPMADKERDKYIKNVQTPLTYYSLYIFAIGGTIWVIYYFFIR